MVSIPLLLIVISLSAATRVPVVQASFCQMQITGIDFPNTASLNQSIQTVTHLVVSCTTSMVDISGRVDLVGEESNKTFSINGFHLGYVSEPEARVNKTVSNDAVTPTTTTLWKLRVNALLFAGGNLVASSSQQLQIQVGQAAENTTLVWVSSLIIVVAVVAVITYLILRKPRETRRAVKRRSKK
jgi:subtilase family serine protease